MRRAKLLLSLLLLIPLSSSGEEGLKAIYLSPSSGGGGVPGGATTQVQFNNAGAFAGDSGFTFNSGTDRLTLGESITIGINGGIFSAGGGSRITLGVNASAVASISVSGNSIGINNTGIIGWTSTSDPSASLDTAFARVAARGIRTSDGSTAIGWLFTAQPVEDISANKTTVAIESNELYTNTADADAETITLMNDPGIAGLQYCAAVTLAQSLTIAPSAGESIRLGSATCSNITSSTIGHIACVVSATSGSGAMWFVTINQGFTCTP